MNLLLWGAYTSVVGLGISIFTSRRFIHPSDQFLEELRKHARRSGFMILMGGAAVLVIEALKMIFG